MAPISSHWFWRALRIAMAGFCCIGIWHSWKVARADHLARLDTEQSLRAAIRIEPDAWRYYVRLADFDEANAPKLLARALQLDAYDAEADIHLGLYFESQGDYQRAQKLLLNGYAVDHTFAPRWALANFYFRREDWPAFWTWARGAAQIQPDNAGAVFELCWRESPDPRTISHEILNDDPELIRQYIVFLVAKDQLPAAASAAQRLIRDGNPETDGAQVLMIINRLVAAQNGSSANALWRELVDRRWFSADSTIINNPAFARDPLSVAFDWTLPSYDGLHSWPGPGGLETEFTGEQPESGTVAEQSFVLAPGKYSFEYRYRTSGIPPQSGLQWQIVDAGSGKPIAASPDLSSQSTRHAGLEFSVPSGASLLQARLIYQRAIGTPRISGMLVTRSAQIELGR